VLRYWETIFKDLKPRKNKGGNRTYREQDLTLILRLKELIQDKKYSTAGAKKLIETNSENNSEENEIPEISFETKKDLKEIRLFLHKLREKL